MDNYGSVTNSAPADMNAPADANAPVRERRSAMVLFTLVMVVIVGVFGASVSAAQTTEVNLLAGDSLSASQQLRGEADGVELSEEQLAIASLEDEVSERESQIVTLEEQVAFLQQVLIEVQTHNDEEKERLVQSMSLEASSESEAMEQWRMGYSIGGGQNLPAFENVILPCESGGQPDPDTAVGPTDDWGRAQINRPTWKKRFESLTGAEFESFIIDPMLNGFMAAHVEQEQGLSAWTCWRKR